MKAIKDYVCKSPDDLLAIKSSVTEIISRLDSTSLRDEMESIGQQLQDLLYQASNNAEKYYKEVVAAIDNVQSVMTDLSLKIATKEDSKDASSPFYLVSND